MRNGWMTPSRIMAILWIGMFLAQIVFAQTDSTPAAEIRAADLAWLAGSWSAEQDGVRIEEHWLPPADDALIGLNRTLAGGRMTGFEFLRIEIRQGGVFYIAQPGGRPPTEFQMTGNGRDWVVFENPAHDFPRLIRYQGTADGRLHARIEGVQDGRPLAADFHFRKSRSAE